MRYEVLITFYRAVLNLSAAWRLFSFSGSSKFIFDKLLHLILTGICCLFGEIGIDRKCGISNLHHTPQGRGIVLVRWLGVSVLHGASRSCTCGCKERSLWYLPFPPNRMETGQNGGFTTKKLVFLKSRRNNGNNEKETVASTASKYPLAPHLLHRTSTVSVATLDIGNTQTHGKKKSHQHHLSIDEVGGISNSFNRFWKLWFQNEYLIWVIKFQCSLILQPQQFLRRLRQQTVRLQYKHSGCQCS